MADRIAEPQLTESGRARIDNFVDSAFAFAVTLLVISANEPPSDIEGLKAALTRVPGFAMGFALVAMFWWTHRSYSRVRPEGAIPLLVSLAVVFVVLVYVYPLRLFSDVFVGFLSGTVRSGEGPLRSVAPMRDLYLIYGIGFSALAVLFLFGFAHAAGAARRVGDEVARLYAEDGASVWVILTLAGVLSVTLATLLPLTRNPWIIGLPGMAYALIPVGIAIMGAIKAGVRSARRRRVQRTPTD
jgi:Endosomal/lysosomal potassium channel TMEM175